MLDVGNINFQMARSTIDGDDNNIFWYIFDFASYDLRSWIPFSVWRSCRPYWSMCLYSHLFHISNHTNFIRIFQCGVLLHKIKFAYLYFIFFPFTKKTIYSIHADGRCMQPWHEISSMPWHQIRNRIQLCLRWFLYICFFIFTIFLGFVFGLVKRVHYGGSLGKCTIRVFFSAIRTRLSLYLQHAHRWTVQWWKFIYFFYAKFSAGIHFHSRMRFTVRRSRNFSRTPSRSIKYFRVKSFHSLWNFAIK